MEAANIYLQKTINENWDYLHGRSLEQKWRWKVQGNKITEDREENEGEERIRKTLKIGRGKLWGEGEKWNEK